MEPQPGPSALYSEDPIPPQSSSTSSIEWNDANELALFNAVIGTGDGKVLIPAGVNKNFYMIGIHRRFEASTKKKVDTKVLWDKLQQLYSLDKLDSIVPCTFPNEQCEFSLPESDFSQLIKDRKNQSSQEKGHDDESRDSGSGRETPPTLPIAKRGAAVQSTLANKRKHSTSISDAGSDGGSARKSVGGSAKSKRRL